MIDRERINGLLFAIMGDTTLVDRWWSSPNSAFDGALPQDVFIVRPDVVANYVLAYSNQDGDFS